MSGPFVSILMPARNASAFIADAIRSVRGQEFAEWELLVVDDFSEDRTPEIVLEFSSDKRILLLTNKARGILPALDLAFCKSKGQFITRMDADDRMPPGKLNLLLDIARAHPKVVATGRVNYFSEKTVSEGYKRYENWLNSLAEKNEFYSSVYRECIVASPNWMVNRACFENDFSFKDLQYPEDYDMVFRWYKAGYKIRASQQVTHLWREHENRTSRTSQVYQQQSFFNLKTGWFIKLELNPGEKIQLLGAGKKGKLVAAKLITENVNFDWFDFGAVPDQVVMSKKIKPVSEVEPGYKTILTAWPADEATQQEILTFMAARDFVPGKNYWLF